MDFDPNDRAAIEAALRDTDPHNPIAKALAERIKELTGRGDGRAGEGGMGAVRGRLNRQITFASNGF